MPSGARSQPSSEHEPLSQGELERDWTLRLIERFDALVLRPSIGDPQEFFLQLAKQLKETFEAELVRVWDYNPQGQYLALQQSYPEHDLSGTSFTIDIKQSFTG